MSSSADFHDNPPPKQGMSSTAKVLIILGSIAGVALLVCCGGIAYFVSQAPNWAKNMAKNFSMTQDPVEVRERTQAMLHVDVPAEFTPQGAMELFVMRWAAYQGKSGPQSMLIIMEMDKQMVDPQGAMNPEQQREQMRQQLREQMRQQQQFGTMEEMNEESHETRTVTIDGKPIEFDFTTGKGKNSQAVIHQVVGVIPTSSGIVLLQLHATDADYNEEAVMAMLNSIRMPADDELDEEDMPKAQPSTEMPAEQNEAEDKDADEAA